MPSGQPGMPPPRPYDRSNASNSYGSNQADYRLQPPSSNSLSTNRSSNMPVSLTFQPIGDERERNDFIFGNICAVSPRDFDVSRHGSYIYVRLSGGDMTGDIVVNCRSRPDFAPGKIYLNDRQRRWGGITERATFMGQSYDPFSQGEPAYLGSMTVEVQMARTKDKNTEAKFNQDKLMAGMLTRYMDQIFAPGQIILMDTGTTQLQLTVRSIQLAELGEKAPSHALTSDPSKRGILHGQTFISFTSAGPNIKFEGSLTRAGGNAPITSDFNFKKMGIGGLDNQFQTIFRRAFASRTLPPGVFEKLGQSHVKGILLYGPPGTGKTLIARKIGQMLNSVEPLVVNGPEILNKYVGASEENIRKLFAPAEKEQKEKGAESQLHIIIFDEFDAICKRRGSGAGGGTGVGDTVVNQLLSKIDGVDQLDNVLIIGMTNRKELIDEALLRPGRMEVHVEISLPDEAGRLDILKIHTKKLQEAGYLDPKVDLPYLASVTKNYSGAELAGLVKAATTYTVTRQSKEGQVSQNIDKEMNVTEEDFELALNDVKAAYGVSDEDLNVALGHGIIKFNDNVDAMIQDGLTAARTVRNSPTTLMTVLLQGSPGAGKTALAAEIARQADFPFVRLITPQYLVGFRDELGKKERVHEIFSEA
jgi:vesicle-fusing ATPase